MLLLHQSLPPYPSFPTLHTQPPSSYPFHTIPQHNIRRSSCIIVLCARSEDDYHATLKALKSKGRIPRKSLGQHYMLNTAINDKLVETAEVRDGDVVLEIGPGTGSLTNVLLNAGATVIAIEKDPHMAALVKERFASFERFLVLQEDFTRCNIRYHMISLMESRALITKVPRHAKVVSNLPFNISTDVVKQLLPMGDIFSEVVLLLQDETASRLVDASLRTSEYRPINIFVNFYSDPEYKLKVLRTNFFPQPNVNQHVIGKLCLAFELTFFTLAIRKMALIRSPHVWTYPLPKSTSPHYVNETHAPRMGSVS